MKLQQYCRNLNQFIWKFFDVAGGNFCGLINKRKFKNFFDELAKHKVQLPVKTHSEWRDFIYDAKTKHQEFNLKIATLEKQLNQTVYQLFDLTVEEIN